MPETEEQYWDRLKAESEEAAARHYGISVEELRRQETEHNEEMDALHECEVINGVTGPCSECGEYSVHEQIVTTLGYRGHPGEERSGLYTCINPDCQHTELAG